MENVDYIIGADLSKGSIDLSCYHNKSYIQITNSQAGFKQLLTWVRQQKIDTEKMMMIMEHTGLYSFLFEEFLHAKQIKFCKISALEIKRSSGLIRGKSDRIDASRIASYGFEKKAKLKPEPKTSKALQRLKMLQNTRAQLVRTNASVTCVIKEYKNIGLAESDVVLKTQYAVQKTLKKQIELIEKSIQQTIESSSEIKTNYELLLSIKGVGKIVATAAIIKSGNFSKFASARKFCCYCGTAPFEHSSGSSIRGKTRVSHLADKEMKTLLDLSAKNVIRYDQEIKTYYERRVAEGKSKMSTINVIRNKMIYRMFAVIKRQTPFVEGFAQAA
jgi:transposase